MLAAGVSGEPNVRVGVALLAQLERDHASDFQDAIWATPTVWVLIVSLPSMASGRVFVDYLGGVMPDD